MDGGFITGCFLLFLFSFSFLPFSGVSGHNDTTVCIFSHSPTLLSRREVCILPREAPAGNRGVALLFFSPAPAFCAGCWRVWSGAA
jgi:hypothetical protein